MHGGFFYSWFACFPESMEQKFPAGYCAPSSVQAEDVCLFFIDGMEYNKGTVCSMKGGETRGDGAETEYDAVCQGVAV